MKKRSAVVSNLFRVLVRLTYERIEKNKINISDMEQSITAAVGKLDVPEAEPTVKDQSILTLIPPCNRGAGVASDVYRLEDVLSSAELDAMDELVEVFFSVSAHDLRQWKESKRYLLL